MFGHKASTGMHWMPVWSASSFRTYSQYYLVPGNPDVRSTSTVSMWNLQKGTIQDSTQHYKE